MLTFKRESTEKSNVPEKDSFHEIPLATQSLLLLLVLVHHWTTQSNPYRSSLFSCLDSQGKKQKLVIAAVCVLLIVSAFSK